LATHWNECFESRGGAVRVVICLLILLSVAPGVLYAQFSLAHKSEGQIAGMAPEQRVEEYVKEYARHYYDEHYEYQKVLTKYIYQDGLRALPAIAKVMGEYDPTAMKKWDKKKAKRHQAAHALLSGIDNRVFRVRAFEEGREAIEAVERAKRRLEGAIATRGNYLGESINDLKTVYDLAVEFGQDLVGRNILDGQIRDTLWYKYDIDLSEGELLSFVNYLIAKDPYYPSHIKPKSLSPPGFKKGSKRIIQIIVEDPEAVYKLYREYKAKQAQ
jgi:hypothetical protein